mgnify:CR=1 FL=1
MKLNLNKQTLKLIQIQEETNNEQRSRNPFLSRKNRIFNFINGGRNFMELNKEIEILAEEVVNG